MVGFSPANNELLAAIELRAEIGGEIHGRMNHHFVVLNNLKLNRQAYLDTGGNARDLESVVFSPNGKWLAACADRTAIVAWDLNPILKGWEK
jgi:hypothetical protein